MYCVVYYIFYKFNDFLWKLLFLYVDLRAFFGDKFYKISAAASWRKNTKIGIIRVCNMIGMSLKARWKRIEGTIMKHLSFSKKCKNLGVWAEFPYLGIWGPKLQNRHNLSLQHDWNVIEGSLEAYWWYNSEISTILKKIQKTYLMICLNLIKL